MAHPDFDPTMVEGFMDPRWARMRDVCYIGW